MTRGVGPTSYSPETFDAFVALVEAVLAGIREAEAKQQWLATRMPKTYAGLLLSRDWDELFQGGD